MNIWMEKLQKELLRIYLKDNPQSLCKSKTLWIYFILKMYNIYNITSIMPERIGFL